MTMDDIDFVYQGPLYKTQKSFLQVKNDKLNAKPWNVLWTSPVDPQEGISEWMKWCKAEKRRVDYYEQGTWHIVPHKDCKILTFQGESEEINKYKILNEDGMWRLDFEAIAKDYDAFYVPLDNVWEYNYSLLKGWDVATCIFFNPKYTVMNEEMYARYKRGEFLPEERKYTGKYDPEINLAPRSLPPLTFKQPVDNSVEEAVSELKKMAKEHSKRTGQKREETLLLYDVINELEKEKNFECLNSDRMVLNNPNILEVLLKHGMDPNMKYNDFRSDYAITRLVKNEQSLKLLLQYGADPNECLRYYVQMDETMQKIRLCLSAGADVNFADENGKTLLMEAWRPEQIELLLVLGANPLAVDKNGKSVKDYFAENPIYHYRVRNVKMLEAAKQKLFVQEKLSEVRKNLLRHDDKLPDDRKAKEEPVTDVSALSINKKER